MKHSGQAGVSLVSILIVMAVGSIVTFVAADRLRHSSQEQQHLEVRSDMVSLRNYVNETFSCTKTLAAMPSGCSYGDSVALMSGRASPNDVIIPKGEYARVGRFSMRAKCARCPTCPGNKMIMVEVAALKAQTGRREQFAKDQLTDKQLSWQDLFKGIPLGCTLP